MMFRQKKQATQWVACLAGPEAITIKEQFYNAVARRETVIRCWIQ